MMRSTAAFCWFVGSSGFIRFFSEGTWSARGWRCPTGASGSNGWSEFIDGAAAGSPEPADCAIAAEVPTRASNAIVVINFRIMGLPSWGPLPEILVRGNLDHKVGQTSHFVQMLRHSGASAMLYGQECRETILAEYVPNAGSSDRLGQNAVYPPSITKQSAV
jgi:hypothetical protein